MNKILISVFVSAIVLSGTSAFAQFKGLAKSTKNLANLERAIARSTAPAVGRPVVTGLPVAVGIPGNAVGLRRVEIPRTITPVTQSYVQYVHTKGANLPDLVPHNWMGSKGQRVLYKDEGQLARDLDAFYKGQADIYKGPDGREVKLYMLPADGILYMEEGEEIPLVLNADEYFVIYDVEAQTGQIAQNIPQVYNLYERYKPTAFHQEFETFYHRVKKAVITREGLTPSLDGQIANMLKRFPEEPISRALSQAANGMAFSNPNKELYSLTVPITPNDLSIYRLEKNLGKQARDSDYWKEVWNHQKKLPYVFNSVSELGQALSKIHGRFGAVVRNQATEELFRVYELPSNWFRLYDSATNSLMGLDGDKYVVLYKDPLTSILIDRETLENTTNFKFYNYFILY